MAEEAKCPCSASCPIDSVLKLLGGKWKLQIICSLFYDGPTRFNTLKKKLTGVSNCALSNALKQLEEDGLVTRIQYNEVPPHVEYKIEPCCEPLIQIVEQLTAWNARRNEMQGGHCND